jgi:beta-ribofuranosylaminobenzene 5'-phosphate synthase
MIRVSAPSRLHFGLLRLPAADDGFWPDREGNPTISARRFGGVGLMISQPGVQVSLAPAHDWSATGPCARRALAYARQFLRNSPELEPRAFALTVERCAPEHVGLGTGSQLGLTVARALSVALGRSEWDACWLGRRLGRGLRSSIGIHGFQHGGFLVDGGKSAFAAAAPLVARHDFPEEWAILLMLPRDAQGVHGLEEREAFAQLGQGAQAQETDTLCRLVLMGVLPALVERDFEAFGEALYDFNRRVGESFKPWQGGTYANAATAEVVALLRANGVRGAGQSSWGPAAFGVCRAHEAAQLACRLEKSLSTSATQIQICPALNGGATISHG